MMASTASSVRKGRREFLQISSAAAAAGIAPVRSSLNDYHVVTQHDDRTSSLQIVRVLPENEGKKPLRLGLIIGIGNDPNAAMEKVKGLGLPTCQAYVEELR